MALSPRDRNALIILGVIAAVALGFFVLTRGGGPPEEEAAPPPAVVPSPVPPPGPAPTPTPSPRPPRFTFFSGRDPFLPLVVAEEGVGAQGTTEAVPAAPGAPEAPVSPAPPGAEEAPAANGGGATTTVGGRRVTLIDIFTAGGEEFAQVEVDGEVFVPGEGEQFAENFRLVSIEAGCANFLFGDESFTLCESGERK